MRTQQTSRKQMSDPTGTTNYHDDFPFFYSFVPPPYSTPILVGASAPAQPRQVPERQPTYLPFLCHPQAKRTAHSHSESVRNHQRREQSSLITEIPNMLEHMDHMPRWRLTAHEHWHQPQEAPNTPLLSSQTLCVLCVTGTLPWAAPHCSTHCCTGPEPQKAVTESSFPYQNSVVLANTNQLLTPSKKIIKRRRDLFNHHMILKRTETI